MGADTRSPGIGAATAERARQASGPALVLLLTIAAWELVVRAFAIKAFILPAPSGIIERMAERPDLFWRHSLYTSIEIMIGFGLAVGVGVLLGIVLQGWPLLARSVYPLLVSAQTVPKVAIAPLFVIWFGFGMTPKVLITFLIAFFPIVIDTAGGLASVDRDLLRVARVMRGNAWRTFWKVRLPSALPQMFAGFKVAATLAVVGAIVGEFVGADRGLGWLLLQANGVADTTLAFGAVVAMAALGTLLFGFVFLVERLVIPWHLERNR